MSGGLGEMDVPFSGDESAYSYAETESTDMYGPSGSDQGPNDSDASKVSSLPAEDKHGKGKVEYTETTESSDLQDESSDSDATVAPSPPVRRKSGKRNVGWASPIVQEDPRDSEASMDDSEFENLSLTNRNAFQGRNQYTRGSYMQKSQSTHFVDRKEAVLPGPLHGSEKLEWKYRLRAAAESQDQRNEQQRQTGEHERKKKEQQELNRAERKKAEADARVAFKSAKYEDSEDASD